MAKRNQNSAQRISLRVPVHALSALQELTKTCLYGVSISEVAQNLVLSGLRDALDYIGAYKDVQQAVRRNGRILYSLDQTADSEPETVIQLVRPTIVTATDSIVGRLRREPRSLYDLSPRQFEEIVAALLQDMGWDVHLTKPTRDGGMDVLAYMTTEVGRLLCLVEAKRYARTRPVGVELVRSLYGTVLHAGANSGLLVTSSYFTKDAYEFQRQHEYQIGLKDFRDLERWIKRVSSRENNAGQAV